MKTITARSSDLSRLFLFAILAAPAHGFEPKEWAINACRTIAVTISPHDPDARKLFAPERVHTGDRDGLPFFACGHLYTEGWELIDEPCSAGGMYDLGDIPIDTNPYFCFRRNEFELVIEWDEHPKSKVNWQKYHDALAIIPKSHAHHRIGTLRPIAGLPVSEKHQEDLISRIPATSRLRSWLVCGPPGASKTTYLAAVAAEEIYRRGALGSYLQAFRVKVPDWLDQMLLWKTRNFADTSVKRPYPDVDRILSGPPELDRGSEHFQEDEAYMPPLIWLEELDKIKLSEFNRNALIRLVDAVYEQRGMILASSNLSPQVLRDFLGDEIYRRIAGTCESPDERSAFVVWDLFKVSKKHPLN